MVEGFAGTVEVGHNTGKLYRDRHSGDGVSANDGGDSGFGLDNGKSSG